MNHYDLAAAELDVQTWSARAVEAESRVADLEGKLCIATSVGANCAAACEAWERQSSSERLALRSCESNLQEAERKLKNAQETLHQMNARVTTLTFKVDELNSEVAMVTLGRDHHIERADRVTREAHRQADEQASQRIDLQNELCAMSEIIKEQVAESKALVRALARAENEVDTLRSLPRK